MAINVANKYSTKLDERFHQKSVTDAFAGKDYDFVGVNAINVYSSDEGDFGDYTRSGSSRFGTIKELGDTVQTMRMTQDKGGTFSIDAGNAAEQFNVKQCNARMKATWDGKVTPSIDKYRLKKWVGGAGVVTVNATPLTGKTAIDAIVNMGAEMSNHLVPTDNRAIFIGHTLFAKCKLSDYIVGIDVLGKDAVANGSLGKLDGNDVYAIPDSYLPAGVNFVIFRKGASVDPVKNQTMRIQKNPLGIDGDVAEYRVMFDSFVLDKKAYAIGVHATAGSTTPTMSVSGGTLTLTAGEGETIKYTTDGSNPKTSSTAKTYSASSKPNGIAAGTEVKAYASKNGALDSGIMTATA